VSDLSDYGLAFLYDPRYYAEDPADAPRKLVWYKRIPLNWLLDAVLRLEGPRFDRGGPYTHTCLSRYPKIVDVRLGRNDGKAYVGEFSEADRRRGLDVYPHLNQKIMAEVFSKAAERAGDGNTGSEYWFSVPSLLWLIVIGYLSEKRFTWLMRFLAHIIPDLPGVFCSEMVADALRRFSPEPFCVYVEPERVRNLQFTLPRRVLLKRIQRASELWETGGDDPSPERAWINFQALDLTQLSQDDSSCVGQSPDEHGRVLVPIGHGKGEISPHLVGLSDLANSPHLSTPVGLPNFP
jgi:hypothetical protein